MSEINKLIHFSLQNRTQFMKLLFIRSNTPVNIKKRKKKKKTIFFYFQTNVPQHACASYSEKETILQALIGRVVHLLHAAISSLHQPKVAKAKGVSDLL